MNQQPVTFVLLAHLFTGLSWHLDLFLITVTMMSASKKTCAKNDCKKYIYAKETPKNK